MSNGENYDEWLKQKLQGGTHYYGDMIRKCFLVAGLFLIILIPQDKAMLSFYLSFGIVFLIASVLLAGLTNPKSQSIIIADLVMSLVLASVFEYLAINAYAERGSFFDIVFLLRQVIAAIALGALYLCTKTLRGMFYQSKD